MELKNKALIGDGFGSGSGYGDGDGDGYGYGDDRDYGGQQDSIKEDADYIRDTVEKVLEKELPRDSLGFIVQGI